MDSLFPSTNPTFPSYEFARQLSDAASDLHEKLKHEKERMLPMGMTIPSTTLVNLEGIADDFNGLIRRIQENQMELLQLRHLARTTELINSSLDLTTVLQDVMDRVVQLVGAERGYIMLYDEERDELEIAIARKLSTNIGQDEELIFSRTIVEKVMSNNEPFVTTNAQEDERVQDQNSVVGFALRSIMCVPLSFRNKITGAVYCDNRIKDGMFGRRELRLLSAFANQAAIAIENARLFEQSKQTLEEIIEIKTLLDNILASIASGVLTTDNNETITIYNPAAETIFGRPAIQTIGHTIDAAIPPLFRYIRDGMRRIDVSRQNSVTLEADVQMDKRGELNLNLTLSSLRTTTNESQGIALVADDLTDIKRRDAQLAAIRRYLSPAMVDNIQAIDRLAFGGERRHVSILFVDVRAFDSFDESLTPRQFMDSLNTYLTIASEGIHHHAGMIDKYMGSEIMSLFNSQLNPSEDHAWQAIQAALRIAADLTTLATYMQAGDTNQAFYRIGIHTGIATLGNVGSAARREFSAIGDSVNLAKRLQENAKTGQILVSEETMVACERYLEENPWIRVQESDALQVKGRTQVVNVYEIFQEK